MNSKVLTLLGFASKAGKLSYGFDAVCSALNQKKSKLLLIANNISSKSQKEILFFGNKFKTEVLILEEYDIETVSHAVGRRCGIISVNDTEFSRGLISAINAGRNLNDK